MITANLKGGLCNMLFQIAATHVHAIKNNTTVKYPNMRSHLSYLSSETIHNPKLTNANEYLTILDKLDISTKQHKTTMTYNSPFHYVDMPFVDGMHVDGYFQSEKYFMSHREDVIELLGASDTIKKYIYNKYSDILRTNTLGVHVRRGDYVKSQEWHTLLGADYYNKGIETISNLDNIIVFSDDIEWCKEKIVGSDVTYIENEKDYIELYLMSMCKNNIISNSSFSWWGAWLNDNVDKKVIAPKDWFGPKFNHFKTKDIIPENWITL